MLVMMRSFVIITALAAIVGSAAAVAGNFPPIWPYPQKFTNGSASLPIDSTNFHFSSNFVQHDCADIHNAFLRFAPVFFPHSPPRNRVALLVSELTGVSVTILNCSVPLQLGVDESYSLEVSMNGGCVSIAHAACAFFGMNLMFCVIILIPLSHVMLSETHKSMPQPYMELIMPYKP
jgi:hypothetical protein